MRRLNEWHSIFLSCVPVPSAGNARHLQTLMTAAKKLSAFLQPAAAAGSGGNEMAAARALSVNDFLFAAGLDAINMFSVIRCGPAQILPEGCCSTFCYVDMRSERHLLGFFSNGQNSAGLLVKHADTGLNIT